MKIFLINGIVIQYACLIKNDFGKEIFMKCKKLLCVLCIWFVLFFVGSAFASTIQEKGKYANLPGVQQLKKS